VEESASKSFFTVLGEKPATVYTCTPGNGHGRAAVPGFLQCLRFHSCWTLTDLSLVQNGVCASRTRRRPRCRKPSTTPAAQGRIATPSMRTGGATTPTPSRRTALGRPTATTRTTRPGAPPATSPAPPPSPPPTQVTKQALFFIQITIGCKFIRVVHCKFVPLSRNV
jgi:hypothetical protein